MRNRQLDTPCVGICSTVYGDDICRGCKRLSQEIIDWNKLTKKQKKEIFDRLGNLITSIVQPKITVHNPTLLRQQLNLLNLRYRDDQSEYCDVYYLLRAGASQIKDSQDFGFSARHEFEDLSFAELFLLIEQEYLALAQHNLTTSSSSGELQ